MVTGKKKTILFIIFGLTILVLVVFIASQSLKSYDETWILGKSRAQIIARYGQFDQSILGSGKEVYHIEDSPLALINDGTDNYLVMVFDKTGKCIDIYRYQPPGL